MATNKDELISHQYLLLKAQIFQCRFGKSQCLLLNHPSWTFRHQVWSKKRDLLVTINKPIDSTLVEVWKLCNICHYIFPVINWFYFVSMLRKRGNFKYTNTAGSLASKATRKGITTSSVKRRVKRQRQGLIGMYVTLPLTLQNRPPPISQASGEASHTQ